MTSETEVGTARVEGAKQPEQPSEGNQTTPEENRRPGGIMQRGQKRRKPALRVTWDEASIAQQDLERGTRQKIEEPPTPWAHSPADVSEEEEESTTTKASEAPQTQSADPQELSTRLGSLAGSNDVTKSPPNKVRKVSISPSPARTSAAASPARGDETDDGQWSTVTFDADVEPKQSSEEFRRKRAQHYDEFRVLQASRRKPGDKSSDESEGSDEAAKA